MFERLGQVLIDAGLITADDLQKAHTEAALGSRALDQALVALNMADEDTIARTLAREAGVECVDRISPPPVPSVAGKVAAQFARTHLVLPLTLEGGLVTVAMADPLDVETRIAVTAAVGTPVQPVCARRSTLEVALDATYADGAAEAAVRAARLLCVDDSATIRGMIASALRDAGWDVREAGDGVEAWACLLDKAPDAIVTDWNMPRLDGIGLVRRIKCHPTFARIPVLMLTSNEDATSELHGLGCGADDYLGKSADTTVLVARVRRLLAPRGVAPRAA